MEFRTSEFSGLHSAGLDLASHPIGNPEGLPFGYKSKVSSGHLFKKKVSKTLPASMIVGDRIAVLRVFPTYLLFVGGETFCSAQKVEVLHSNMRMGLTHKPLDLTLCAQGLAIAMQMVPLQSAPSIPIVRATPPPHTPTFLLARAQSPALLSTTGSAWPAPPRIGLFLLPALNMKQPTAGAPQASTHHCTL